MIRLLLLCLLLLVSACTLSMSREEQVENILPTPSITPSISSALETDAFHPGGWPTKAWWTQYASENLNALIEKALERNPSIQAIQERISFAKAEAIIARSELYPLIYFDASDQWQYLSENGLYKALNPNLGLSNQQIDFSLSFTYEFDFWGKYRNLYNAALGRQRAAIAEAKQVELIVSAALAQTFFALKTNLLRREYYENLWEIRRRFFGLQEKLLNSGIYSQLPPLLSEEAVFQAKQWLYQVEQEIEVNKHTLNTLAGQGPDEPLALGDPLSPLPPKLTLPATISTELLSRRPDLMAQIWRVDALAREVGSAKADFFPDINIVGLLGFQSGSWEKLFQWASKTIGALPGLSLPVYTAGAIGANVDAKHALFNEAVYQYNDLILKSFQQVSDLIAIGRSVFGEKLKQEEIVSRATQRYLLTADRRASGLDSALTLYQFEEELLFKQIQNVELLYQQYLVSISLVKALGGGYLFEEGPPL